MANEININSRVILRAFSVLLASIFVFSGFCSDSLANPESNKTLSPFANLTGKYIDHGTDINHDGRYEFLTVETDVNVQSTEEYSVVGTLYDQDNKEIAWAIDHKKLNPGLNKMQLDFDGKAIRSHDVNGPYQLKDVKLTIGSSSVGLGLIERVPVAYNTSFYNASDFVNPLRKDMQISGSGDGELLLTISIKKTLPVFLGKYSLDIVGINIPPISSAFNVKSQKGLKGYDWDLNSIYVPGKPNNFTVTSHGVKNINVGLKKLQPSLVWKGRNSRIWVTAQTPADKNSLATVDSDLISPGIYQAKIFGDAADNVSQVDLSMTLVKKMIMNGKFNLAINTTGFPAGNYSITAKAINGSLSLDELAVDGMSMTE